jgi:hypothetical protein
MRAVLAARFVERAKRDVDRVHQHVQRLLQSVGLSSEHIPYAEAEYFVRNLRGIKVRTLLAAAAHAVQQSMRWRLACRLCMSARWQRNTTRLLSSPRT